MANFSEKDVMVEVCEANGRQRRVSPSVAFVYPFGDKADTHTTVNEVPDPGESNTLDSGSIRSVKTEVRKFPGLRRTRSEDVSPRVREQWGTELWNQGKLQESLALLRSSVADYEKEASQQQWKDLLKINADVADLGKLAAEARWKKSKKGIDLEEGDALSKFSTVAFEYSKLFDAVMNQSPEYAGLAWGIIRVLLVAHTNHSRLKYAVEQYIIQFGQGFGIVNNLMMSHPSEKMVEAVCEAYTAFSKFLAKALKYYKESRMMSAIKAFGFPWENKFQALVVKIEVTLKRISDIAHAGHIGMTIHMREMVETIGCGQEEMRDEICRNNNKLRQQLKQEMKEEISSLFQTFDRDWISRFEQIILHSVQGQAANNRPGEQENSAGSPKDPSTWSAETSSQGTSSQPPTASFLSDHVGKPKRLKRFRDRTFPLLQNLDNDQIENNIRLRYTSNLDLQHIMGLLRNDRVRSWLPATASSLMWINTVKLPGPSDWATTFSMRIVEHAAALDNMVVLYHLCGSHPTSSSLSTPVVVVQSLIMQLLEQRHKEFVRQASPFTMEHFQDVRDDIGDLWDLFLRCCVEAKANRVCLVLDHVDNLRQSQDYEFMLQALLDAVNNDKQTIKILCSARLFGTPQLVSETSESDSSVYTVTIPRGVRSNPTTQALRQQRAVRLPDDLGAEAPAVKEPKVDIDALLYSSSDEEVSASLEHTPVRTGQTKTVVESTLDDDSDIDSDDSMGFTREDPFASAEDDDEDNDGPGPKHVNEESDASSSKHGNQEDSEDSDGNFAFAKPVRDRSRQPQCSDELEDSDTSQHLSNRPQRSSVTSSQSRSEARRQWQMQRTASLRSKRIQAAKVDVTTRTNETFDSSESE